MQFYAVEPVNSRVACIRSACGELLYLVEGDDRAALIDTCTGVGHLKSLVDSLTDKPLTVLLTHGHVDHAPGAPEFDTVYMDHRDIPLYRRHCRMEERRGYLQANLGPRYAELRDEDFVPEKPDMVFLPLENGMLFDLGGLHIQAVSLRGHTQGATAFLLQEERILVLGDTCNNSTFLFDEEASTVEEYLENVCAARDALAGTFDRVFLSHHEMETGADIMDSMISLCDELLTRGGADDIPFDFMGKKAFIAKDCDEKFHRRDGRCGNLIYSKEKLYLPGTPHPV